MMHDYIIHPVLYLTREYSCMRLKIDVRALINFVVVKNCPFLSQDTNRHVRKGTLPRDWPTGDRQSFGESSMRQLSIARYTIFLNHFFTAESSITMFHDIGATAWYLNNEPSFYLAPLILIFSSLFNQIQSNDAFMNLCLTGLYRTPSVHPTTLRNEIRIDIS